MALSWFDQTAVQISFISTEYFPFGYKGTIQVNIELASWKIQTDARVGDALIAFECTDGTLVEVDKVLQLLLPNALEIEGFGDALISKRKIYTAIALSTETINFENRN